MAKAKINFKIKDVHYTGGNIYCYFGELSDGTYFMYSDWYELAEIYDSDPLEPSDDESYGYVGYDPEFTMDHCIGYLDEKFCIRLIKKANEENHLSVGEAEQRIDELRSCIKWNKEQEKARTKEHDFH